MRRQIGALMLLPVVAFAVSGVSSTAKADDDASRFTYVRLHCTPDNQSHFTDVTIESCQGKFRTSCISDRYRRQQADFKGIHCGIRGALGRC